eukprot:3656803-Ditylum_brightwellii.AAC.1
MDWSSVLNEKVPWEFHWDILGSSCKYLGVSSAKIHMLRKMCWENTVVFWVARKRVAKDLGDIYNFPFTPNETNGGWSDKFPYVQ